jgi:membrane protein DedA with SNARE-associated domain
MDGMLVSRAIKIIAAYGLLAVCVFAFLESSMLFPYLPAEVVVPVAAGILVTDWLSLGLFVFLTTVGGTIGALVAYAVSHKSKQFIDDRFQKHLRVSERQRARAVRWFEKWGEPSVIWGRFLPFFRSVVSIPAGLTRMPLIKFTAYTTLGNAGFYFAVAGIVFYGRARSLDVALRKAVSESPLEIGTVLAVAVAIALVGWWATDRSRT